MSVPLLRVDRIELENYRCFPKLSVEFHPRLTVLAARNGMGKTAVLDAIAIALGPFVGAFDEGKGRHFEAADARLKRVGGALTEMEPLYPVVLMAEGLIDGQRQTWRRRLASSRAHTTYAEAKPLDAFGQSLQQAVRGAAEGRQSSPVLPLVAYYGTGRLWSEMRLTSGKRAAVRTSRTAGYTDSLASASRFRSFVDWFERLSRAEYEERDHPVRLAEIRTHLEAIRTAVDRVLQPTGWGSIAYKSAEAGIVATHPTLGVLPIDWLSDGIRTMIGLAADIAHRAVRLNAHLGGGSVTLTPGIVLIDEIEMHLHPEWQQVVVEALTNAFPQIQFVLSTHSPQIVSSVHKASVRVLQEKEEDSWTFQEPAFQTRGVESSEVLARIMGVDPIPQVPEAALLADYRAAIERGEVETDDARAARTKLAEHFGSEHPLLRDCDRLIRFHAFKRRVQPPVGG